MFSNIFLNKTNLENNLSIIEKIAKGKLCVMVKANAYGHGAKEIVKMLNGKVEYFGVSNQREAEEIRDLTQLPKRLKLNFGILKEAYLD